VTVLAAVDFIVDEGPDADFDKVGTDESCDADVEVIERALRLDLNGVTELVRLVKLPRVDTIFEGKFGAAGGVPVWDDDDTFGQAVPTAAVVDDRPSELNMPVCVATIAPIVVADMEFADVGRLWLVVAGGGMGEGATKEGLGALV
jgi:hypothetical protein